ncbi:MAG: signal peptidase II [Armatimonadetes bacterium]|nr:signal peptidase II [Armatimonadota bacterium]
MNRRIFLTVFTLSVIVDQVVKEIVRQTLNPHQSVGPWPGVFEITLQTNEGIAFGMFQGIAIFLTPIAIAIGIGSYLYSKNHPQESAWIHTAMALLAGGALGNLIDRVFLGRVTDMFAFRLIHFPVFNVADSCITIAAAILILKWSRELVTHHPEETAEQTSESEVAAKPSEPVAGEAQ